MRPWTQSLLVVAFMATWVQQGKKIVVLVFSREIGFCLQALFSEYFHDICLCDKQVFNFFFFVKQIVKGFVESYKYFALTNHIFYTKIT